MIFYIYKLIPIVIAAFICIMAWKVTHYFIREIDKIHYVKGYVENLKFPKKLTYYISQMLIFMGLAIIPVFLAGQAILSEKGKKADRLLAYNLYITPLIGIGGYGLIIYSFMEIAEYFDLRILSRSLNLIGAYVAFFIVPYYIILGIKRLYRLNRNDKIQIEKLGYTKESGVKKHVFVRNLFTKKLEDETDEEFENRKKELSRNWHFIYEKEDEWLGSKEVYNNFTRMNVVLIRLILIYIVINFLVLIVNVELLESELVSITNYNKYVYPIARLIYSGEIALIGVFMINYWIGRPFKYKDKYLKKNIISITNIILVIVLVVLASCVMQGDSPVSDNGTIKIYDRYDRTDVKADAQGIKQMKSHYIQKVKHQRDYESFNSYEKTLNVMDHPKKFERTIQRVGQDRVSNLGTWIAFESDNALNKEREISIHDHGIVFSDGTEEMGNRADIRIFFYGPPELCIENSDANKLPGHTYNYVDIEEYGVKGYENDNLCALEHDLVNTTESFYSEVLDDKMLGIKSTYVGSKVEE